MIGPRWTIRSRLFLGFGLAIVALLLAGAVGIFALGRIQDDVSDSVGEVNQVGQRLFRIHDATLRLVALSQAELTGAAGAGTEQIDSLSAVADSLRRLLITESGLLDTNERTGLERIGALQSRIEVRLAVARAYSDLGRSQDGFRQAAFATTALDSLFAEAEALNRAQERRSEVTLARITTLVRDRRIILILLLILGLAVAVYFGQTTWHAITGPLDSLVAAARKLGGGDLRVDVPGEGLDREFAELAEAVSATAGRLRGMLTAIRDEAEGLANAAASLNTASEQLAASTGEISGVMVHIASDAAAARENVETSSTVLDDVGIAAGSLESTASQSRSAADQIRDTAGQTRFSLMQALESLSKAQEVIQGSADAVTRLERTSKTVEDFVRSVAVVADQTELLSLNASIEAARAGEHGRGFAVVAEQVRRLATDSAGAAEEVRRVVDAMHAEVASAVISFKAGAKDLGNVGSVSRDAANALDAIDQALPGVQDVTVSVSRAADGARAAVEALNERLRSLGLQAESQAAASEEAAAAAEETAAAAEEVAATARTLQGSADSLKGMISRFEV